MCTAIKRTFHVKKKFVRYRFSIRANPFYRVCSFHFDDICKPVRVDSGCVYARYLVLLIQNITICNLDVLVIGSSSLAMMIPYNPEQGEVKCLRKNEELT